MHLFGSVYIGTLGRLHKGGYRRQAGSLRERTVLPIVVVKPVKRKADGLRGETAQIVVRKKGGRDEEDSLVTGPAGIVERLYGTAT